MTQPVPVPVTKVEVTKEQFESYLSVQRSGLYNMFDPMARLSTGLSKETYQACQQQYSELTTKYRGQG